MNTLYKCMPDKLQCGDRILITNHTWVVKVIVGPDRIGTYELYLRDDYGNEKMAIVTEPVTLLA